MIRRSAIILTLLLVCALRSWAVKVAVVLPFKDSSAGQASIEFYRGFLLAVDSVKRGGLSVEVYALDSGTTVESLATALSKAGLTGIDVVFGPGLPSQTEALANYCRQAGTKLVVPFPAPNAHIADSPNAYLVQPPEEALYPAVGQLAMENLADANFVMFKCADGTAQDHAFQASISERVEAYGLPRGTLNVNADDVAAQLAFSPSRRNVIVPDSHSEASLNTLLSLLSQFSARNPRYVFTLLGYPSWLALTGKRSAEFHSLDAYLFSQCSYDPQGARTLRFTTTYWQCFGEEPPALTPSPAMLGFDVGYYFLCGVNSAPLQNDLLFRQQAQGKGHLNTYVELVHFGTDKFITNIR